MSRQHKYTNHNVCYSKIHQQIVHWFSHLFVAIYSQANQHISGHVNHYQHKEQDRQEDVGNGSHSNNNKFNDQSRD